MDPTRLDTSTGVRIEGDKNVLAKPTTIAKERLFTLKNELVICRTGMGTYQSYFTRLIGKTLFVYLPYRTEVSEGRELTSAQISPLIDRVEKIEINQWWKNAFKLNADEMTFSVQDFVKHYMGEGTIEIGEKIETLAAQELGWGGYMTAGTVGSALDPAKVRAVRAKATRMSIPVNSFNYGFITPEEYENVEDKIETLDAPRLVVNAIEGAYQKTLANFKMLQTIHVPYLDNAAPAGTNAPLVNYNVGGDTTYEGNMLPTDGWQATAQKVLNRGQLIQIANVNEVEYRGEKRLTGHKMTFTVVADVNSNAAGSATIRISPELNAGGLSINDGSGTAVSTKSYKNVDKPAADNAVVTVLGDAGNMYRQTIFSERNAFQVASVMLAIPSSFSWRGQDHDPDTGLSISVIKFPDINSISEICRSDVVTGFKTTQPELIVRSIDGKIN